MALPVQSKIQIYFTSLYNNIDFSNKQFKFLYHFYFVNLPVYLFFFVGLQFS